LNQKEFNVKWCFCQDGVGRVGCCKLMILDIKSGALCKCNSAMRDMRFRIADCETGNPPEGWKSEGQFKIKEPALRQAQDRQSESRIQKIVRKIESFFAHDYFLPTPCAMRYASFTTDNGPRTTDSSVLPPTSNSLLHALPVLSLSKDSLCPSKCAIPHQLFN